MNLEAVYPDYKNPGYEISFEELRAISRGWMQKDWSLQKKALKEISGNATSRNPPLQDYKQQSTDKALEGDMNQRLAIREKSSHQTETVELQEEPRDGKSSKARKIKVREIGETITSKHIPLSHELLCCDSRAEQCAQLKQTWTLRLDPS